jgi:hypothetical protein
MVLHPDLIDETDNPTREAASCFPFVVDEACVGPIRQRLAERAAAMAQRASTLDPELHIVVQGRAVPPLYVSDGRYSFVLQKGVTEIHLVSRAAPADVRPGSGDCRSLGVPVNRIRLRGGDVVQDVQVDHPCLSQGWWAAETDGLTRHRWTNGNAVLPLPMTHGPAILEISVARGALEYPLDADDQAQIA